MKHLGIVLLIAMFAWAQRNASITGSVTDGSGAAIATAEINLRNINTGESFQATTGEEGTYTFPLLPPGSYELRATKSGFK